MKIGNKEFDLENNVYIMGILNVTPDSFSDGGKWNDEESARAHIKQMIEDGAEIIDIGGESTRPGYEKISDEEEIARIIPYIKMAKEEFGAVVSVDTYKSKVAEAAVLAGADLINDIWGFKYDPDMAKVAAKYKVPCCIMHNRNLEEHPYRCSGVDAKDDFISDVLADLMESIEIGISAGVDKKMLITDPGVGFAKNLEQNLQIMNNLEVLKELDCPILLGTSRKSMIGLTLDLPVDQRVEGTLTTSVIGMMKGASIIRVHDVKENYRAVKMAKAILGA